MAARQEPAKVERQIKLFDALSIQHYPPYHSALLLLRGGHCAVLILIDRKGDKETMKRDVLLVPPGIP